MLFHLVPLQVFYYFLTPHSRTSSIVFLTVHVGNIKKETSKVYLTGETGSCPIGPLQFTITWYKNRHAGEQTAHWDIQNKAT